MDPTPVDPICGMPVDPATARTVEQDGRVLSFCSEFCREEHLRRPSRTGRPLTPDEARAGRRIAYFSMEIALDARMPTYAGGLGVLAGDTLRSCADLRVPVVGVSLLHRKGYFRQQIAPDGRQIELPASWEPEALLAPLSARTSVAIAGRTVAVRAWRHDVVGATGYVVPVLLLDTDLPENTEPDRRLTDVLYGGDAAHRLAQEIVLGIGGVRALESCGYSGLRRYHLNEGHASLAALELLRLTNPGQVGAWDFDSVRTRCVFTTHTPVPAGHDRFEPDLVRRVLGDPVPPDVLAMLAGRARVNMTLLALNLAHYVNGVARKHEEISEHLFPGRDIGQIPNGVHSATWTADSFRALYDRAVPGWKDDPAMLRQVLSVPPEAVWGAHVAAKQGLIGIVRERAAVVLRSDTLTVGFARRSTGYKRSALLFRDLDRLRRIGAGKLQFVFAGKAHPADGEGRDLIRHVVEFARALGPDVPVAYLPDHDLALARSIVAGVDVWLNTPLRPFEASGTSGMKAAHNGVPSLSVLDGWWIEGCIEGVTGWAIGGSRPAPPDRAAADAEDAADLYRKLEDVVCPLFYGARDRWISVMQHAIALNASFFNTHRMVQQYVTNAYLPR